MNLLDIIEQAVGNEHLISHDNCSLAFNQISKKEIPNLFLSEHLQPDSNKIVNIKSYA